MQVQEVPLKFVNIAWPDVEPFLKASIEWSDGEFSIEEVKTYLVQGMWSLYVAVDDDKNVMGATTVQYFNRTDNRVAFITNIGGKLLANKQLFSQLSEILKSNGATCVEGAARDSLVRLWSRIGARKKSNLVQIKL